MVGLCKIGCHPVTNGHWMATRQKFSAIWWQSSAICGSLAPFSGDLVDIIVISSSQKFHRVIISVITIAILIFNNWNDFVAIQYSLLIIGEQQCS